MPTRAFTFEDEPWRHEWNFSVTSHFGDPDEDRASGFVSTIKASSDEEAERRVLTYVGANFDDDLRGAVASGEGLVADGVFQVRMTWTRR